MKRQRLLHAIVMPAAMLLASLPGCPEKAVAQDITTTSKAEPDLSPDPGAADLNLVKMNITAVFLNNFSFQYERILSNKFTVAGGIRFMPRGGVPLLSAFEQLIDDEEVYRQLDGTRVGNIAFTAEGRWYAGKRGAPKGFYLAPYLRFASYSASMEEFEYSIETGSGAKETRKIPLDGKLNTFSGGLLFGAQWPLGKRLCLDWWILGPSIGSAGGDLTATASLDAAEQEALRGELDDLDIQGVRISTTVNGNGANAGIRGPWAGLRAGISIGFRF